MARELAGLQLNDLHRSSWVRFSLQPHISNDLTTKPTHVVQHRELGREVLNSAVQVWRFVSDAVPVHKRSFSVTHQWVAESVVIGLPVEDGPRIQLPQ